MAAVSKFDFLSWILRPVTKVFRADVIKNIQIKPNRFDFEPEITAKILWMINLESGGLT